MFPGFESLPLRQIDCCGGVAQLGERFVRNEEVSGSIPLISTKLFRNCSEIVQNCSEIAISGAY